jgi:hypothetical protein
MHIESRNIAAFTTGLATEIDPVTRATLIRLLEQEEAKTVARLTAAAVM